MEPARQHFENHFFRCDASPSPPYVGSYVLLVANGNGGLVEGEWVHLRAGFSTRVRALEHAERHATTRITYLVYQQTLDRAKLAVHDTARAVEAARQVVDQSQELRRRLAQRVDPDRQPK